ARRESRSGYPHAARDADPAPTIAAGDPADPCGDGRAADAAAPRDRTRPHPREQLASSSREGRCEAAGRERGGAGRRHRGHRGRAVAARSSLSAWGAMASGVSLPTVPDAPPSVPRAGGRGETDGREPLSAKRLLPDQVARSDSRGLRPPRLSPQADADRLG